MAKFIRFILCSIHFTLALAVSVRADDRQPLPAKQDLAKTLELFREIYSDDIKEATSLEEKARFSAKLLKDGIDTQDDWVGRYVLLKAARDMALKAGATAIVFDVIDALDRDFEIDGLQMKSEAIKVLSRIPAASSEQARRVQIYKSPLRRAVSADRYDLATSIVDQMLTSARKARDGDLVKTVVGYQRDVARIQAQFENIQPDLGLLAKMPDNPGANSNVGSFYCFWKRDWQAGIPYLALGTAGDLKKLAILELSGPSTAKSLGAVADGWWSLSEKHEEPERQAMRQRAAQRYRKAIPERRGLALILAKERIESVAQSDSTAMLAWLEQDVASDQVALVGADTSSSPDGKTTSDEAKNANAPPLNQWVKITNRRTTKAVGVFGGSTMAGARVVQWVFVKSAPNQNWRFERVGKNRYRILNRRSQMLLTATRAGTPLIQSAPGEASLQTWQLVRSKEGWYKIVLPGSSNVVCLAPENATLDGIPLILAPAMSDQLQEWSLEPLDED